MSRLMQPFLGDLMFKAVVAGAWLFILILVASAWWEKRRAHLLREQAINQHLPSAHRVRLLQSFLKRFRAKLAALLVVASLVIAGLLLGKKHLSVRARPSADSDGIAAYATNFQGDATCPVWVAGMQEPDFGDVGLAWTQSLIRPGKVSLRYAMPQPPDPTAVSTNTTTANAIVSADEKEQR